jgi:hypothetical protein
MTFAGAACGLHSPTYVLLTGVLLCLLVCTGGLVIVFNKQQAYLLGEQLVMVGVQATSA